MESAQRKTTPKRCPYMGRYFQLLAHEHFTATGISGKKKKRRKTITAFSYLK